MKVKTGTPLDNLLNGGIDTDCITNIYGPAGSGKTNICMIASRENFKRNGKTLYIDTEANFSFDRARQIEDKDFDKFMKSIILKSVYSWKEQIDTIKELRNSIPENVKLIIVDSLVSLYRLEIDNNNYQEINKQLASQYSILTRIAREKKIPVLVTNQIYSSEGKIEMTSRFISRYWPKVIIELKRSNSDNNRLAVIRKHHSLPEGKYIEFEIVEKGLKPVGKFKIF